MSSETASSPRSLEDAIDAEAAKFSQFKDSERLWESDKEVWYGILAGAALVSPELRAQILLKLRASCTPLRYRRLFGAIFSDQQIGIRRALSEDFGVNESNGTPVNGVLDQVEKLEDAVLMIEARSAVSAAACTVSPSALVNCLEAQAKMLRQKIRNFQ